MQLVHQGVVVCIHIPISQETQEGGSVQLRDPRPWVDSTARMPLKQQQKQTKYSGPLASVGVGSRHLSPTNTQVWAAWVAWVECIVFAYDLHTSSNSIEIVSDYLYYPLQSEWCRSHRYTILVFICIFIILFVVFLPKYFQLWLIESEDVEPSDTDSQLCSFCM